MAEVFVEFESAVAGRGDRLYVARACGRPMVDGKRWEGWIEFLPDDTSPVLRTPRETVQPNREDLRYWSTGLTTAYLEGALERALKPPVAVPAKREPPKPLFDGPAPSHVDVDMEPELQVYPQPVLDPFRVYEHGEERLRRELSALEVRHLRNIVLAYGLGLDEELDIEHMSPNALAELILAAVRKRTPK